MGKYCCLECQWLHSGWITSLATLNLFSRKFHIPPPFQTLPNAKTHKIYTESQSGGLSSPVLVTRAPLLAKHISESWFLRQCTRITISFMFKILNWMIFRITLPLFNSSLKNVSMQRISPKLTLQCSQQPLLLATGGLGSHPKLTVISLGVSTCDRLHLWICQTLVQPQNGGCPKWATVITTWYNCTTMYNPKGPKDLLTSLRIICTNFHPLSISHSGVSFSWS